MSTVTQVVGRREDGAEEDVGVAHDAAWLGVRVRLKARVRVRVRVRVLVKGQGQDIGEIQVQKVQFHQLHYRLPQHMLTIILELMRLLLVLLRHL